MPAYDQIVNEALALLNQDPLTRSERSQERAALIIDSVRRRQLTLHPWYFARKRVNLSTSAMSDAQYKYTYNLPADCLMIVHNEIKDFFIDDYDVVGKQILSNVSPFRLVYIYDFTDYDAMPPWFYDLLKYALAIELIPALTSNYDLEMSLRNVHMSKLREARHTDAIQGPNYTYDTDLPKMDDYKFITCRWL